MLFDSCGKSLIFLVVSNDYMYRKLPFMWIDPILEKFFIFWASWSLKCEDKFQIWNLWKKLGGKVTGFRKKRSFGKKPMIGQQLILWRRGGKEREVSIGRLLCDVEFICNGLLSMWHFGKYFMFYWACFLLIT